MMTDKKYDFVFSLGQWCATAIYLKKLGFRKFSSPFDWTGPEQTVGSYVNLMIGSFSGFMEKRNMRFITEAPTEGTVHYIDVATGYQTHHEFKIGVPFDDMFRRFRGTMDRRIERLLGVLKGENRILFVQYRAEGHYDRRQVVDDMNRLRSYFQKASIDLLVLETEKFSEKVVREELSDGVEFYTGDFYDRSRYDAVLGNEPLVKSVLNGIRMRGCLRNLVRLKFRRWAETFCRKVRKGARR